MRATARDLPEVGQLDVSVPVQQAAGRVRRGESERGREGTHMLSGFRSRWM